MIYLTKKFLWKCLSPLDDLLPKSNNCHLRSNEACPQCDKVKTGTQVGALNELRNVNDCKPNIQTFDDKF